MTDGLFAQPRRKRGPAENALDVTLRAMGQGGMLAGDEYAADRAALRDLARAADMARSDAQAGEGSPWVLAQTASKFREAVESYRARMGGDSDSIDAFLASISGPPVRDTPDA